MEPSERGFNLKPSRPEGQAPKPSIVTLPDSKGPFRTLLDFLKARFPHVPEPLWRQRLECGDITNEKGAPMGIETPFQPSMRLFYYREVEKEPLVPFQEKILFEDDRLIAAVKPHFLPVTPSGPYVNECLLYRLRERTGREEIAPLHRIDRETAGIVLFSVHKKTRGAYQRLFDSGSVRKRYEAVGGPPLIPGEREWVIESRIEKGDPFFRMEERAGAVNAKTAFRLMDEADGSARYEVRPATGKKHQIRIHMCRICSGIKNDRYYPDLLPESRDDFTRPLKLLAKEIAFTDPLSGEERLFLTEASL